MMADFVGDDRDKLLINAELMKTVRTLHFCPVWIRYCTLIARRPEPNLAGGALTRQNSTLTCSVGGGT
jgi:hypothetical protein